jgi:hypothetical protein
VVNCPKRRKLERTTALARVDMQHGTLRKAMQRALLYRDARVYAGNEKTFILSERSIARTVSLTSHRQLFLIPDLFSDTSRHPPVAPQAASA